MKVHLYTILWNEEAMLPFFFRHYDPIVDRYVMYDDGSTDSTLEILAAHPKVEVRRFTRTHSDSFGFSAQALQNSMWKESRGEADWVIITAVDEHLYHPAGLPTYLQGAKRAGVTVIPALAFQMVTDVFPSPDEHLATSRRLGVPLDRFNKLNLFDPWAVEETNYELGRHTAALRGRLIGPKEDQLLLFHYKFLGLDYLIPRYALLRTGLGASDNAIQFGGKYHDGRDKLVAEFEELRRNAFDVTGPEAAKLQRKKWWRKPPARPG